VAVQADPAPPLFERTLDALPAIPLPDGFTVQGVRNVDALPTSIIAPEPKVMIDTLPFRVILLVLERMTTPDTQPALHTFFRTLYQRSAEELAHTYIEVAQIVSYALEIVIANHVATAIPLILEGDTIVPELAAKRVFANLTVGNQVRSVFLVESDEVAIMHNVLERGRGVEQLTSEQLQRHVRFSWLYGQWIEREARKYGLAIITAQPRETLVRRILETLQNNNPL
jgi:2-phosphoglycerate kinase